MEEEEKTWNPEKEEFHPAFQKRLKAKFKEVRHFYLRIEENSGRGRRRFGIITLGRTYKDRVVAAATLCSLDDQFSAKEARKRGYKRLYKWATNDKEAVKVIDLNAEDKDPAPRLLHDIIRAADQGGSNEPIRLLNWEDHNHLLRKELRHIIRGENQMNQKSTNQPYIVLVEDGIGPYIVGLDPPFASEEKRNETARTLWKESPSNDIFALDIDELGKPDMWSFSHAFMKGESEEPTDD